MTEKVVRILMDLGRLEDERVAKAAFAARATSFFDC
jgi:hypothetical protein